MITFKWNNYEFSVLQLGLGVFKEDMAGHSHSKNSYELHFIIDGEGTLTTDSKSYPLSKGDFFVTGPNMYHQQSTNKKNPLKEIFVYLQTDEQKTNDILVSTFLSTHFYFAKEYGLQTLFENILNEIDEKKFGYESAVAGIMQLLLTQITRIYAPHFNDIPSINQNLNDRRFLIIEKAFIENSEKVTLSGLAAEIGLCERQTQRLLQKYYGKSFKEKKSEALNKGTTFKS